jgi:protein SCO1/2
MTRLLVVAGVALLLAACRASGPKPGQDRAAGEPAAYAGALINPPARRPEFILTDTSGSAFDFQKATQGRVTLLYFGYTHCPDVCPTQMATIAAALEKVPESVAGQVQVIFVTTDPQRDTPDVLRQWLDHFDQRIVGLTGTPQALSTVERQVGLPPSSIAPTERGDYAVDHAAFVIAYTQDDLAHLIYPEGVSPDGWARDLTRLVQNGPAGL